MKSILVICEGNICRSPMGQALLAQSLPGIRIASAGLGALVGHSADPIAVNLLKRRGIDISDHRAVQINRSMCLDADMVLAMEAAQRNRLQDMQPALRGRIFLFGEFGQGDVPDPYRKPESVFEASLQLIEAGAAAWAERIRKL